ncbi:hypothetical protein LCGC14_0978480 [marine sediment metagenome]|uniref:Uncharacterized protein n=1 Tax=marine sediment metagenome TaxID=412755 RepID=A0A0F9QST5_9ZZZZ
MADKIPASLYWPDSQESVSKLLKAGIMPATFARRMRLVNLLSQTAIGNIDPALHEPYNVYDLNDLLNKQVSHDAIIDVFSSEELKATLKTGNVSHLEEIQDPSIPTARGLRIGALKEAFSTPFDALNIMLAMKTKMVLNLMDQCGHTIGAIREKCPKLFGDEFMFPEGGDPSDSDIIWAIRFHIMPYINYSTGEMTDEWYMEWNEKHPHLEPYPLSFNFAPNSMAASSWFYRSPFSLTSIFPGPPSTSMRRYGSLWNCCKKTSDPTADVTIGYTTLTMDPDDVQNLTVTDVLGTCPTDIYTWQIESGDGALDVLEGTAVTFTAPSGSGGCAQPAVINLLCNSVQVDSISIVINPCPVAATINYTTLGMAVDEVQALSVTVSSWGCGTPTYDWAIASGGGSLSSPTGATVDYTAPSSNPECANNATIELSCDGNLIDSITIAVNGDMVNDPAYGIWNYSFNTCCGTQSTEWCPADFNCSGNFYSNPSITFEKVWKDTRCFDPVIDVTINKCNNDTLTTCSCPGSTCMQDYWDSVGFTGIYKDVRTGTQKTNGCCPEAAI